MDLSKNPLKLCWSTRSSRVTFRRGIQPAIFTATLIGSNVVVTGNFTKGAGFTGEAAGVVIPERVCIIDYVRGKWTWIDRKSPFICSRASFLRNDKVYTLATNNRERLQVWAFDTVLAEWNPVVTTGVERLKGRAVDHLFYLESLDIAVTCIGRYRRHRLSSERPDSVEVLFVNKNSWVLPKVKGSGVQWRGTTSALVGRDIYYYGGNPSRNEFPELNRGFLLDLCFSIYILHCRDATNFSWSSLKMDRKEHANPVLSTMCYYQGCLIVYGGGSTRRRYATMTTVRIYNIEEQTWRIEGKDFVAKDSPRLGNCHAEMTKRGMLLFGGTMGSFTILKSY